MGAKAIDLELETLEGAGGYAREMTEDRAARQRELLTPYIAAADAPDHHRRRARPAGADAGHPRDGRADEARLGRRRPRRRERRQRRGLGGRRGGPDRQRPGLGRPQRAEPDARTGVQALRPEHRQPGHPDDRHGRRRQRGVRPRLRRRDRRRQLRHPRRRIVHEPTREAIEGPAEPEPTGPRAVEPSATEPGDTPTSSSISPTTRRPTSDLDTGVVWLTIFVLSVFVGIEVISKVSSTLHTPLMSGANAIHGIILLGAILVTGTTDNDRRARRRAGRDRAGRGQHGRRLRGHRPDAADVRRARSRQPRRRTSRRAGPPDADLGPAGLPRLRRLLHPRAQGPVRPEDRPQRQPARRRRRGRRLR